MNTYAQSTVTVYWCGGRVVIESSGYSFAFRWRAYAYGGHELGDWHLVDSWEQAKTNGLAALREWRDKTVKGAE